LIEGGDFKRMINQTIWKADAMYLWPALGRGCSLAKRKVHKQDKELHREAEKKGAR